MLHIATDILPPTYLSYVAFRLSFCETLERILLADQVDGPDDGFGYLTEVPFLKMTRPLVQLDLLAETWQRHRSASPVQATLVDESVVYAICETAARVVEQDPYVAEACLRCGPGDVPRAVDGEMAFELRAMHLSLSNSGDFLLISQFEDLAPDDARKLKQEFGMLETRLETMFDVLGRWHPSPNLIVNTAGLLTDTERIRVGQALQPRP